MNKLTLIFLFVCSTAFAGDYVCYNPASATVSDQVDHIMLSVDGSNLPAECIKVDRSTAQTLMSGKWKWSGSDFVALDQTELDALDAVTAAADLAQKKSDANNLNISIKDAFQAWLTVYNSKVPAQYRVTGQELINQYKTDHGL